MTTTKIETPEANDFPEEDEDPFLTRGHINRINDDLHSRELWSIDKLEVVEDNVGGELGSENFLLDVCSRNAIRKRNEKWWERNTKVKSRLRIRYPCSMCSKIFHHIRLLNEHVLTHKPGDYKRLKKFEKQKCPQGECKREFISQIALTLHLGLHARKAKIMKAQKSKIMKAQKSKIMNAKKSKIMNTKKSKSMKAQKSKTMNAKKSKIMNSKKSKIMKVQKSKIINAKKSKIIKSGGKVQSVPKLNNSQSQEIKSQFEENGKIEVSSDSSRIKVKKPRTRRKKHKCGECDKEFGNAIVFKKHLLIHDLSKQPESYKCTDCHREFYSEHGLRVHRRNYSNCKTKIYSITLLDEETIIPPVNVEQNTSESIKDKIFKCPDCPREFPGVLKLDIHLVSVHLKEPKCSECGKTFPNGPRLFRHHNVHKLPTYKCPHENCNAAFRTKEGLVVHQRKHDGILPHICPVCQIGFKTKPQCILHRIEAHGQKLKAVSCTTKPGSNSRDKNGNNPNTKTYPCLRSGCEAVYKYEQSLTIHLRKHDGILPYVCPICQEAFPMKQQCLLHRIEVHKENLKRFAIPQKCQCETCGATFRNPYTLKNHIKRQHSNQKNLCCEICGKKFALDYDFKVHKSYHAGAKSFICEQCGKSFNSKGDLVRHSWSHKPDSEKPFQCNICGKGFVRKVHFVDHEKYHSGEPKRKCKPKKVLIAPDPSQILIRACKFCGKAWITKDGLRSHLRRVHGRDSHGNIVGVPKPKLYTCDICTKIFHKRIRLVEHYQNVHGKKYEIRKCVITPPQPHEITPPQPPHEITPPQPPEVIPPPPPPKSASPPEEAITTEPLSDKYPTIWGQLPCVPISNFCPPPPLTAPVLSQPFQFPFQSHFDNSNNLLSVNNPVTFGIPSAFTQPLEPFYLDKPIYENSISTLPSGETILELQTVQTGNVLDCADTLIPMVPAVVAEENPALLEQNLLENEKILIPDEPKWESLFEPEINLDDFFDHSSTNSSFNDGNKYGFSDVVRDQTIFKLQEKNSKLTEDEKMLVRKVIGFRCLSLTLNKLPIYHCKICSMIWHDKHLFEKHCRSIAHWEAIRRIKDKEVKNSGENSGIEDLDIKRKCSICGIRFSNLKILLQHCRNEHPGQKAFSCQLCGTAYYNYKHLRHHRGTFHKVGDFVCVVCKEKFSAYEDYRKHITSSHKDIEWKCPLCKESVNIFGTLKKLADHCEVAHPGQKPFSCDICGTTYLRYKDYRNHRSRFHNGDNLDDPTTISRPGIGRKKDPRRECKVCGKSVGNMSAHMTLHSGEKTQLCDLCGKSFRKKCNLVAHKKRHSGETRFQCTECAKPFYRRRDLRLHYAIHTKNYSCTMCTQKFATDALLQKHSGLHDQRRPFRCTVCGFMFNYRGNLVTHMKKLHTVFQSPSDFCLVPKDQCYPVQDSSPYHCQPGIPEIPGRLLPI